MTEDRQALKASLANRDLLCVGCGEPLTVPHMHEALISRRDVQGWPARKRLLIMDECNCILLCAECNLGLSGKSPPSREKAFEYLTALYGKDAVLDWLASLPFKDHPLKGWLRSDA